jgi:hypothetical protein
MDYWHKAWVCPYFRWDEKLKMGCECGRLVFPDRKSAVTYMEKFCADEDHGWKGCSIAKMTNDYYERIEANEQSGKKSDGKEAAGT